MGLIEQFRTLMNETFDAVIFHYIGLYQEAADGCEELIGDLEIFPGRKMADTSEEEQVRILKDEIDREYRRRAAVIGVNLP